MNREIDANKIATVVSTTLRVPFSLEGTTFVFVTSVIDASIPNLSIEQSEIEAALDRVTKMKVIDELGLASSNQLEVLIKEEGYGPGLRSARDESFVLEDNENSCRYTLGRMSNDFAVFLFSLSNGSSRPYGPLVSSRHLVSRLISEGRNNPIEIASHLAFRYMTLRIDSNEARTTTEFSALSDSFLFQISYNLDVSLVVQRHTEELFRANRITSFRRSRLSEIDPPRRKYVPDLVYHYQLAIAADNPFLEFLSFYHIAEHFFESVFNDDLIDQIRSEITKPEFSYKRKKDIGFLIKKIGKSIQYRSESMSFNEQNALELTIRKFVDLNSLLTRLNDYDPSLVDFYSNTEVAFCDGSTFDMTDATSNPIKNIASRIYRTRNAIVHSKESEKKRFVPFKHDKLLLKEVPLVRFIAEEIIIQSSEVL